MRNLQRKDIRHVRIFFFLPFFSLCWLFVGARSQWRSVCTCKRTPIDLINSFFTLHWLWVHRSNSHYITTLGGWRETTVTHSCATQSADLSLLWHSGSNGLVQGELVLRHGNSMFYTWHNRSICPRKNGFILILHNLEFGLQNESLMTQLWTRIKGSTIHGCAAVTVPWLLILYFDHESFRLLLFVT